MLSDAADVACILLVPGDDRDARGRAFDSLRIREAFHAASYPRRGRQRVGFQRDYLQANPVRGVKFPQKGVVLRADTIII
jgi:hypothetical protein